MTEPLYTREGTATLIRNAYRERMTAFHASTGRSYYPNPRHDTKENWLKAADRCIEAQSNPQDFVDAAFAMYKNPQGPFASQLCGSSAVRWAQAYAANKVVLDETVTVLEEEIKYEFVLAHQLLQDHTGFPEAWRNLKTMSDEFASIRPFIRVAMAGRDDMRTVVKKFAKAAEDFLRYRPQHVAVLNKLGYDILKYLNDARS